MADNIFQTLTAQQNFIALAPLAGVSDLPFRTICRSHGATIVYTEMVSAKALCYQNKKSAEMLATTAQEAPCVVQLFGSQPQSFAHAVKDYINDSDFAAVDINMGCPVPKVTKNKEGSALMRNEELAFEIVSAVKDVSQKPVSVKIRAGWDNDNINAPSFALKMQQAGADMIIVHPRTKEQGFSGKSDWSVIAAVKDVCTVPVIANGDIFSVEDAANILTQTHADGIMIGRGAMGNPWLFGQIVSERAHKRHSSPGPEEIFAQIQTHLDMACAHTHEKAAVAAMRKHLFWYTKGLANSAKIRKEISLATTQTAATDILKKYLFP